MSLRFFRWGAVALAVVGLLFLYLWARNKSITPVKIADIQETMNMAYVRVEGTVGRVSSKRDARGRMEYMRFDLDDGTGLALVKVGRHVAGSMDKRDLVPRRGDEMSLAGSVRVGPEGQISLFLQTADHVVRKPASIPRVSLEAVSAVHSGRTIDVEGRVARIYEPGEGSKAPVRILLRDETGSAMLVAWPRTWKPLADRGVEEGASVSARVTVSEYRGKMQLLLDEASDLVLQGFSRVERSEGDVGSEPGPRPETAFLEAGALDREMLGRTVTVLGVVSELDRLRQGTRIRISGEKGTTEIYLSRKVASRVEPLDELRVGGTIRVRGKVTEYKGRMQVAPRFPSDVQVVAIGGGTGGEVRPPQKRLAGSIDAEDVGAVVVLSGTFESVQRIPKGTKAYLVDEGGGRVAVVVWDTVRKKLRDPGLLLDGRRVQVVGVVSEFRGEIQVVPEEGWDVIGKD